MSDILEKIKEIPKLYHAIGCSEEQLAEAERALGVVFPSEFRECVREYGAISFYGTEWTGLGVEGYLNVVEATRQERELNPAFPADCFVLENLGMEGVIVAADKDGQVWEIQGERKRLLCQSLGEYLELCRERGSYLKS